MAAIIKTLEDFLHNKVYPKTKVEAVYDDSNNRLDSLLSAKENANDNFIVKGSGSATPSISDPELRQSDISTTQSTSAITVPSSSLVKTMNDSISQINSQLTPEDFTSQVTFASGYTASNTSFIKYGHIVWANITLQFSSTQATTLDNIFTIPEGYRPTEHIPILCADTINDYPLSGVLRKTGTCVLYNSAARYFSTARISFMYII